MGTSLRPVLAAVPAALLLLLTGCTGDAEPSGDATGATTSAPAEEQTAPDEGAAAGEEVDTAEFVEDMRAGLDAATTARLTMSVDAAGQSLTSEGQVDYTTDPPTMLMQMSMPAMSDEPLEVRVVDGTMYMNMGRLSQGKYLSFDLDDSANLPPGMDGVTEQLDPLGGFADFEDSIRSVTYVGEEDLDGEQLDHYEVTVDVEAADGFQGLPTGQDVPDTAVLDLWVDEDFLARRMTTSLDAGNQSVSMDMRMSDWGEPVDIEAPPTRDVLDPGQVPGLGG